LVAGKHLFKQLASVRASKYFGLFLSSVDILLILSCYLLSFYLRFGNLQRLSLQEPKTVFVLSPILWILLSNSHKLNKIVRIERIEKVIWKTFRILLIHFLITLSFVVILKFTDVSRLRMLYFYGLFTISILFYRVLFVLLLKYARKLGYNFRTILFVGNPNKHPILLQFLQNDLYLGYKLIGYINIENTGHSNLTYLGDLTDLEQLHASNNINEVFVASELGTETLIDKILLYCDKNFIRVKFAPIFHSEISFRRINIDFYNNVPIVSFRKEPLELPGNRIIKRIMDIIFSISVLVLLLSWLYPLIALLIKASSKGPVLFKQVRTGEHGKVFTCYKFRSMQMNSNANLIQATKNDTRTTGLGKFLRKTNLDELPQFFNVLIGNMSVVGPRPHMLKHTEHYSELMQNYLVRHLSKPGITGWAQVNGFRGEIELVEDLENRVNSDIWYVENWSFLLDLKIIGLTILNMIRGQEKAY